METRSFSQVLARRWWMLMLVFLITIGATAYLTYQQPSLYVAKVTYITRLSDTLTDSRDISSALDVLNRQGDLLNTYSEVIKSQMIKTKAATHLGFLRGELNGMRVSSRVVPGTKILEISVEGKNPVLAKDFANAIGVVMASYANNLYPTYRLELLDQAQTPNRPASPNMVFNLIVGGILGLFFGFVVLLISAWISGTFRKATLPEEAYSRPLTTAQE